MQIKLKLDGKDKTFVTGFVSAKMVRRTIEISKSVNFEDMTVDELDLLVQYIVDLFGNQFTIDDVYEGLPSGELFSTFTKSTMEVTGQVTAATGGTEKN